MTTKQIQAWLACQMPGAAAAWQAILFARTQAQDYLFAFELKDIFQSTPQSNFEAAWQAYLASAGLEVTTENIPPFGDVEIIYINTAYVDDVGDAALTVDYDDGCAVWGFNGAAYPS